VGNGGNTLPANEALGEPWPLGWGISPPSAYSEPIGPDNPLHSKKGALERFEKASVMNLHKELINDVNDNDNSAEDDKSRKIDENNLKEKEKDQSTEKAKSI
jgi:hypothetical protein